MINAKQKNHIWVETKSEIKSTGGLCQQEVHHSPRIVNKILFHNHTDQHPLEKKNVSVFAKTFFLFSKYSPILCDMDHKRPCYITAFEFGVLRIIMLGHVRQIKCGNYQNFQSIHLSPYSCTPPGQANDGPERQKG